MGERQNLTRIFADKTIKTIFYTEDAEDTDKTKELFLFWFGSKKQKAFFSFGQSQKCKPSFRRPEMKFWCGHTLFWF